MSVTFEEITKQFHLETERAANRELTEPDDLPISYEDVTPAWLTAVLAGAHPGAQVTTLRLDAPSEGTSSRRRIFLTWNDAGLAAGMPASVFCKGTQSLGSRFILGMNGGVAAEASFFNLVRPGLDIHAPEALFARWDPTTFNSIVIMRDLGDVARFTTFRDTLDEEQARSQLRALATLHAAYFDSPELDTTLEVFNNWETFFAITVELAGFGPACARGLVQAQDLIPPRLFARADEIWPATLRCVDDNRRRPRTLIHSDGHLGNWHITGDGEMGLNDWQCASKGTWSRDVAYTLSTGLTPDDRRAWERDLVAYYVDELAARGGPKLDGEEAFRHYRQQMFAALAWWTGTLGQPPEAPKMQPEETSRAFITRITAAIDDLDSLEAWD